MTKKVNHLFIKIFLVLCVCRITLFSQSNIVIDSGAVINVESNCDICSDTKTVTGTLSGSGTWCAGALPVELFSFNYEQSGMSIKLNWMTKTEKNSSLFVIEKKIIKEENKTWNSIGEVHAADLSNSPKEYTFTDYNVKPGKYQYRLKMQDNDGTFEYSKVLTTEISVPEYFELNQNFPNPFNPGTTIKYSLPYDCNVRITIYNSIGQIIKDISSGIINSGYHELNFNASSLSSGVYFYTIQAHSTDGKNNYTATKKMLYLK